MGGANAVITAIIQARDFATPTIQRVSAASRAATMSQIQNVSNMSSAISNATKQYDAHLEAQKKYEQNTHRMGMSTGRLIMMMVKFGIILKGLQLITSPLKLIGEGINDLVATDRGVREMTGMLREQGDTSAVLTKRYADLTTASRNLQRQFGFTAKDSVAGLYDVASVIQTMNIEGFANDNTEAIIKFADAAGRLAIGGFMPLQEATSGLTTVFNALDMPVSNISEVMDIMFNAVKIGKGHLSDLTNNMGAFLEVLGNLTTKDNRLQAFQETMGIFGYLTTVVSAPRAGTAVKRLLEGVAARTPQQQDLIGSIEKEFGVDLSAARFSAEGPKAYYGTLLKTVGPDSSQLSSLMEQRLGYTPSEAQMRAVSTAILERFTGDKRAATALLSMKPDQMDNVYGVMAQRGSAAAAESEAMQAYETRWNIFQQRISVVAQTLQQNSLPKIMGFFDGVSKVLDDTMSGQAYMNMDSGTQLKTIVQNLGNTFQNWFTGSPRQQREGGSGREGIRDTMREWGMSAAGFFMAAFGVALPGEVEKNRNYFFDAANTMVSSLTGGFFDTIGKTIKDRGILGMLGDVAGNPLARGAGTFFGLLKMGVPWFIALPLSIAGGATASGDIGGIQGPATAMAAIASASLVRKGIQGAWGMASREIIGPISAIPGVRGGVNMAGRAINNVWTNASPMPLYSPWSAPSNSRYPGHVPGMFIPGVGYMPPPNTPSGQQLRNYPYSPGSFTSGTMTRTPSGLFVPAGTPATGPAPRAGSRMGRAMNFIRGSGGSAVIGNSIGAGVGAAVGYEAGQQFFPGNDIAQMVLPGVGMALGGTTAGMVGIAGGLVVAALWETAQTIGVVVDNWDKVGKGLQNWWEIHFPGPTAAQTGSVLNMDVSQYAPGLVGNRPSQYRNPSKPGYASPNDYSEGDAMPTTPVIHVNIDVDHMNMDRTQLQQYADMAYDVFVTRFGAEASASPNVAVGPMIMP